MIYTRNYSLIKKRPWGGSVQAQQDASNQIGDITSKIPIVSMFKTIGETGANLLGGKEDEYGVRNGSKAGVVAAGFLNPLSSTMNLGQDLKKHRYGQFAKDLLLPGFGLLARNNKLKRERDFGLAQQRMTRNRLLNEEQARIQSLNDKYTLESDRNYLNTFRLSNPSSLYMKSGGKIYIKPENRGKFNSLKKRTGKSTEELTHSKNPLTRKRAIFAQNARKWNHANGGPIDEHRKKNIALADAGAKRYRDSVTQFDSLRTILRPVLQKSGKDHLTSEEIRATLGDKGHDLYNQISDYLSNVYNVNKRLGIDMNEFRGTNENTNNKIANYLYGTKVDSFKFPNVEFPYTETVNGKTTLIYKTSSFPNNKPSFIRANGGKIATTGLSLGDGNKLLTKNGSTSGSHESGANIPIKKKGRTLAIAEPGEVLVNDKSLYPVPFVLSKRLGFAQDFMKLEDIKNPSNEKIIEKEQSNLVKMNNRLVSKGKFAQDGKPLNDSILIKNKNVAIKDLSVKELNYIIDRLKGSSIKQAINGKGELEVNKLTNLKRNINRFEKLLNNKPRINNKPVDVDAISYSNGGNVPLAFAGIPLAAANVAGKVAKGAKTMLAKKKFGNFLKENGNTIIGAVGTASNLALSNKTLKYQKGLIKDSLQQALAYKPTYSKSYLLNDNIDINDNVSAINQGYNSVVSGLNEIDPAIASALKNNANQSRVRQLNSIFAQRNNLLSNIRNQNVLNIASNNANNTQLDNQTALMKLNARISANEQLGEAANAGLGNIQGAISEFNSILRDKQTMDSLKARWKDSIGTDFIKAKGGRLCRRRKSMMYR